jgi:5-methylcytosine-specific restriction endonuclease McrA
MGSLIVGPSGMPVRNYPRLPGETWEQRQKRVKSLSFFRQKKNNPEALSKRRKRYQDKLRARDPILFNKRILERVKRYQARNRGLMSERSKRYAQLHIEEKRLYMAQYRPVYYQKNRERLLAQTKRYAELHPDIQKKARAKWVKNNPEKRKASVAKNTAKRRGAIVFDPVVDSLIEKWRKQSSFTCFYCNRVFSTKKLHIDHVTPVSKHGKHTVDNVCKSCPRCNVRKNAKLIQNYVVNGQPFLL